MIHVGRLAGGAMVAVAGRHPPGGNVSLVTGGSQAEEVRRRLAGALGRGGAPIAQAHQVHGSVVHDACKIVDHTPRPKGDAVVCWAGDEVLGMVVVADCLPIAIAGEGGGVAAVHAGWRGLHAGVIEAAAAALEAAGEVPAEALIGPGIGPCCYEFGSDDLDLVVQRYGASVRGLSHTGAPALDLRAAALEALARRGVDQVSFVGGCTACEEGWFSWRRHRDAGRQGLLVAAGPA